MANSEPKYLVISSKESDSERRAFVSEMLKDVRDDNITFVVTNKGPPLREICGGNEFYARSMYEEASTFVPAHPITCMTGYTPESPVGDATWRRIRAARTNDMWKNLLKSDHQVQGRIVRKDVK